MAMCSKSNNKSCFTIYKKRDNFPENSLPILSNIGKTIVLFLVTIYLGEIIGKFRK